MAAPRGGAGGGGGGPGAGPLFPRAAVPPPPPPRPPPRAPRPLAPPPRLRPGGGGPRAPRSRHRGPPHPAELRRAVTRAGELHLRLRDPRRGDPGLSGRRGAAVRPVVGQRDRGREERDPRGVLGEPLPGPRADPLGPRAEPPRRRAPRHAGPPPARPVAGDVPLLT